MARKTFSLWIFFFFAGTFLCAQSYNNGAPFLIKPQAESNGRQKPINDLSVYLGLSEGNTLTLIKKEKDKLGNEIERYAQSYKNVPVEYAVYKAIKKNGRIVAVSGEFYNVKDVSTSPSIEQSAALQAAKEAIGALKYDWENGGSVPAGTLTIFAAEEDQFSLAYKFNIYALDPLSRNYVYVDANTGRILAKEPIIKHTQGDADTRYSGRQKIETSKDGSFYTLRDVTRGGGIETYNLNQGTSYFSATDFTDLDNNWTQAEFDNNEKDNAALDAHIGVARAYDYFSQEHGRNSFDDNGAKIQLYVHYGQDYINAFWNGEVLTFGDGGFSYSRNATIDPLTSIDIVAHEYAHAICEHTANLVYQYEPGALNESLSDIWGATIKYWADNSKNYWLIGDETNFHVRSMNNPNERQQPDTYLGDYWYSGQEDQGGVHVNSGVMNFWYYLLVEGGSDVNDNGEGYSVDGIGFPAASEIVYRTETVYLTPNSGYEDARRFSVQAAEDLFGAESYEAAQCIAAWDAVGVYDLQSAPDNLTAVAAEDQSGVYVTLTWVDNSDWETGFEVYRSLADSDSFVAIDTVGANQANYLDKLDPEGGRFTYKIRAISETQKSGFSNSASILAGTSVVVMHEATINACSGTLLDPGGLDDYPDDADVVMTIRPKNDDNYVTLDFEEFNLESWSDYLRIFDGASQGDTQIGSYTGSNSPSLVASTNEEGALTLRFTSDASISENGFQASIGCLDTIPLPDLIVNLTDTPLPNTLPGQSLNIAYDIKNQGFKTSGSFAVSCYLSEDEMPDSTDVFVSSWNLYNLQAGGVYSSSQSVTVPYQLDPGSYFVLLKVDDAETIDESSEDNNVDFSPVELDTPQLDLALTNFKLPLQIAAGNVITVETTLKNESNTTFPDGEVSFYLSPDTTVDDSDLLLASSAFPPVALHNTYSLEARLEIPDTVSAASYEVIAVLDPENDIPESDESNNTARKTLPVQPYGEYFLVPYKSSHSISLCSATLYDHGGEFGDYRNNSSDTLTIFPAETGRFVQLTVEEFELYDIYDRLTVFNGPDAESPAFGSFGYDSDIPVIYSSDESGALTLIFSSNYSGSKKGFKAAINCIDEIPASDIEVVDFFVEDPVVIKEGLSAFAFTAKNNTSVPVKDLPYELYLTSDSLGLEDKVVLFRDTIDMLWLQAVHSVKTFSVNDTVGEGTMFMWLEANPDRTSAESNYANNIDYQGVILVDPAIDLVVSGATISQTKPYPGANFSVDAQVKNKGAIPSPRTAMGYYISDDSVFHEDSAIYLGYMIQYEVDPASSRSVYKSLYVPDTLPLGQYYIHLTTDHENQVEELFESNNSYTLPIQVSEPFKDLELFSLDLSRSSMKLTDALTISGVVKNHGNLGVYENFTVAFYLSSDPESDAGDILFYEGDVYASLQPGSTFNFSFPQARPASAIPAGDYYLIARVDGGNEVEEENENNNFLVRALTIEETVIDVAISKSGEWPDQLRNQSNAYFPVSVRNDGQTDLYYVNVHLYLSEDEQYSEDDKQLASGYAYSLTSGETETLTLNPYITGDIAPGDFFLIAKTDFEYEQIDRKPENNRIVSPAAVKVPEIDYFVAGISPANQEFYKGENLEFNTVIANSGPDDASGSTYLQFYVSKDTIIDPEDTPLGARYVGALNKYDSAWFNYYYDPGVLDTGVYYAIAHIDEVESLAETNEENNIAWAAFKVVNYDADNYILMPVTGVDTTTACSKILTDNGGMFGDYEDNADGVLTIYPDEPGTAATLDFTSFQLESCCDYLEIFDGGSVSDPRIGIYQYTDPGFISATNPQGALTLRFYSDGSVTRPGFTAEIGCKSNLENLPDLKIHNVKVRKATQFNRGDIVTLTFDLDNQGGVGSQANLIEYYLSEDEEISMGDIYLGSQEVKELLPSQGLELKTEIELPNDITEGDYYIITRVRGFVSNEVPVEQRLEDNLAFVQISINRNATPLGLSEETAGLRFYPNPVGNSRQLTVFSNVGMELYLFNATGKFIKTLKVYAGESSLMDLGDIKAGLYILKGENKGSAYRITLVVN